MTTPASLLDLNPAVSSYTAFTGADQSITLPEQGGFYILSVAGNSCVVRTGGAATMTGTGLFIPESSMVGPFRIDAATLRVIGASAAGGIWVVQVKRS